MFGRSRPVLFDPRGRRRSRWRLPPWLLLLLAGAALGVLGVVAVQERVLPPRLSAGASAQLRVAFDDADAERRRLRGELAGALRRLDAALAEKKSVAEAMDATRSDAERLRQDLTTVVAALPADPRGGTIEVRAGRFTSRLGQLRYDVVLTREAAGNKAVPGVMQLLVAGESERGVPTTVTLDAVTLSVASYAVVRGSVPLPAGFKPHQTTVRVLDRTAGRPVGMRVLPVK
jgi:hypothetical protein